MTKDGITRLVGVLEHELPEALPDRWDVVEPPSHKLAIEGTQGLIAFLDSDRWEMKFLWAKKPVYELEINASSWGGPFPWFVPTRFHLGLDSGVLSDTEWSHRLPKAFGAISQVVKPFYGEARLYPDPSKGPAEGQEVRPVDRMAWFGVPNAAPIALVVGSPYREHWPSATNGELVDGLVFHSSDSWPSPPASRLPSPPVTIAQERDISLTLLPVAQLPDRDSFAFQHLSDGTLWPYVRRPERRPDYWPFSDERFGYRSWMAEPRWPVEGSGR